MEEANQSVIQEVAPQAEATDVQTEKPKPAEDPQEKNWRVMRERQKELERELRMQREINERLLQQPKVVPVAPPDELDSLPDDEYIPAGKVKQLVKKTAAQVAEDVSQRVYHQQQELQWLDRLKKRFSDFEEVVNPETLSLLETQDPELAQEILDFKDNPYKMGVHSYRYIKALGLASQVPSERRKREIDKKIEKNEKTVQTPQAFDKRPMAQAFRLTDTEKKALYNEMMGYAQQAGSGY